MFKIFNYNMCVDWGCRTHSLGCSTHVAKNRVAVSKPNEQFWGCSQQVISD